MATKRIKDLYIIIMYILACIGVIAIVLKDFDFLWIYLLIGILWVLSFTLRNLFIYNDERYLKHGWITYGIEILLMFILHRLGGGEGTKLLLYITLADCYIVWGTKYGIGCGITYFLFYIIQHMMNYSLSTKDLLLIIGRETPVFLLAVLITFLIERVLKNGLLLEKSMEILEEREIKLKSAYEELSKAYRDLEEMSTLKERNRIAREIHDTVGHTITTVIVEMEAGRMLSSKNIDLALQKYNSAQSQAQKSLDELRRSVRMLADDNESIDLKQRLEEVIEETQIHANITVRSVIDIPERLNAKYSNVIIRALKEGFANGIRHGGANAYFFKLVMEDNNLVLQLQDNGRGCDDISLGFGLDNMQRVIKGLGGIVSFSSSLGEGFELQIALPVIEKGVTLSHG